MWLDKRRLKTECKEVNAAHRTELWHWALMCVLEAVNPITSCISQLWHPLRHQGENGLSSLQRKSSSHMEFRTYPSPILPFHLHHWTRKAETLNNSSIFYPNPRDKLTQARSEATEPDWWKTSASPQFSPLPPSGTKPVYFSMDLWLVLDGVLWRRICEPSLETLQLWHLWYLPIGSPGTRRLEAMLQPLFYTQIKYMHIHHISYDKFLNIYHIKISTHQNHPCKSHLLMDLAPIISLLYVLFEEIVIHCIL